ncbi:hypothetical protein E1211_15330 [Micromonospora sp. 15K316]|uniref:hypothetical protein n=1 Tax=Micromonospora sp. 15K316 TaxID=2530376 RepID=UPI0010537198|nr:hypothetical protein [Micromonospora sp. 15K316]TDC35676.1 hypothetical protein E1211_15330 [Micromonospora sp. 15K316]
MRDLWARLLARLGAPEVARMARERDQARADRAKATKTALRLYADVVIHKVRADALAATYQRENSTP